jgi:hypothetical protein
MSTLQSHLSLLIPTFKGVSQCIPLWAHFPLVSTTLSITLLYISLPPPLFNSFQYMSWYPLPAQMLYISILLILCHSLLLSLIPQVPWGSSTPEWNTKLLKTFPIKSKVQVSDISTVLT